MVIVLVTGAIWAAPEMKLSGSGKPYASAIVRSNHDDVTTFWRVIAFDATARTELLRLGFGEAVSIQGKMRAEISRSGEGEPRLSLRLLADAVLSLRSRSRAASAETPSQIDAWARAERDQKLPEWP